MDKILTKQQLKQAEKIGRWLRKHAKHNVVRATVENGHVLVCEDCAKASVQLHA